jgi:AAA+ ATPase superfamily predicted ATPase
MKNKIFQAGRPVIGEKLIGREKILENIVRLLISGQSVVLIAPRRFGKTSLLIEALTRIKNQGFFTANIDIFATPTKRILAEQITESVLKNRKLGKAFADLRKSITSILKQFEFKQVVEEFEFILHFAEKNQDDHTLLADSIDFIDQFAVKNKKEIVCGFDEFGDIEKMDGKEIVKLFRSKVQLHQHASYIFSGSHESVMNQIFITSKSPFYRFARVIEVSEIESPVFKAYIEKEFSRIGVEIKHNALDRIMGFSGGHPYYTQLVCQELQYVSASSDSLDSHDVDEAIEEAFWSEISYIEKTWDELSSSREQTQVLIAVAENVDSIYQALDIKRVNVSRALRKLTEKGIIKKKGKNYYSTDPMLMYFIRRDILKWDKDSCLKHGD